MLKKKTAWIITVYGGYGSFPFWGTREQAEEMRRHKARWEGAVATLREARPDEARYVHDGLLDPVHRPPRGDVAGIRRWIREASKKP